MWSVNYQNRFSFRSFTKALLKRISKLSALNIYFFKISSPNWMLCAVRKLTTQSLLTSSRKDIDDSEILRQAEVLGLIITCLLKFPVYWHIFDRMSTIYLQGWTDQRGLVLWFWTKVSKKNANSGKNLSCIKPSKSHQVSAVQYNGWFK